MHASQFYLLIFYGFLLEMNRDWTKSTCFLVKYSAIEVFSFKLILAYKFNILKKYDNEI